MRFTSATALGHARDEVILAVALAEARTIITADTDFGALLVLRQQRQPSIVLFRHGAPRRPADQATLLLHNLGTIADDLTSGAIVTIGRDHMRVPRLS
jgi:predicted nuclease of predicted toxin-antitoxin system